jgi:hypothetical protein
MNPELNKYRVELVIVYKIDDSIFCDTIIKGVLAYTQDSAKIKASNDIKQVFSNVDLLHVSIESIEEIKPEEPLFVREGFKNEE